MKIYILRNPFIDPYIDEYVRNAEYFLKQRGYTLEWVSECSDVQNKSAGIVFFFWTSFQQPLVTFPEHMYVLINTEQLTRPDQLKRVQTYLTDFPNMLYADYSTANLKILQTDRKCGHLPFVYHPVYAEKRPLPKHIALLFYGAMSDYRQEICIRHKATVVSTFGSARDRMIRLSKCVLNAHYNPSYQVFESMRIHHAIYLGTPVFLGDESLEEELVLSETAKKYLLKSPEVPPLSPLDPAEETEIGRRAIDTFISCLSLPTPTAP